MSELVTISPDQLTKVAGPSDDSMVPIFRPGGPMTKIAWNRLLAKLVAADTVKATSALLAADLAWAENKTALVHSDPDPAKNGWWRKVGAAAAGNWVQFEQLTMAIRAEVLAARDDAVAAAGALGTIADNFIETTPPGYQFAIADEAGRVAFGIKDDGTVHIGNLQADSGVTTSSAFSGQGNFAADVVGFFAYGQSLSCGISTGGSAIGQAISTVQRFDNLMLAAVRTWDIGYTPGDGENVLLPHIEQVNAVEAAGETPCAGAAEAIKELILAEDGVAFAQQSYQILSAAPGAGGHTLDQLDGPTGLYQRFISNMTAAKNLAVAAGKTFKMLGTQWLQGESETPASLVNYAANLSAMRANLETAAQALTGQSEGFYLFAYDGTRPDVAVEMRKAADLDPKIIIAGATYQLARSDTVHFTALTSKVWGAYAGRAFKRTLIDGTPWRPLEPIGSFRQGSIVELRFHVPHGPLAFDTVGFAAQANMGFSVFSPVGAVLPITSVAITQPDTVRIVCSAPIAAGSTVRYAFSDPASHAAMPGGNLRDSDPTLFDGGGIDVILRNWCIPFQETV